jgi:hypothetical protein
VEIGSEYDAIVFRLWKVNQNQNLLAERLVDEALVKNMQYLMNYFELLTSQKTYIQQAYC